MRPWRAALLGFMLCPLAAGAGVALPPQLLDRAPIAYPPSQLASRAEGFVSLKIWVLPNGAVERVEIDRSSGFVAFDDAATAGARKWIYSAARDAAGNPVAGSASAVVNFNPADTIEWRRIVRIWNDYRRFLRMNEGIFSQCEAAGLGTRKARTAVAPDAATVERAEKLTARLLEELNSSGNADPEPTLKRAGAALDAVTDDMTRKMFAKWNKDEVRTHCRDTLESMVELGWLYPGSDELFEF